MLLIVLAATIALGATAGSALAAQANDDFMNAETMSGNRGVAYFDLTDATAEATEPQNAGTDERTLWFRYTPSATGFASFAICDAAAYPIEGANLSVFTGSTLATLSVASESSGGCPAGQTNASIVAMAVTAGTTYSVQLGSTAATVNLGGALVYDFNTALPTNDDFGDAQEITGGFPQTLDADTGLATMEPEEPDIGLYGPFNSLWYRWTPAASGAVSLDTCSTVSEDPGHPADSKLDVFTDSNDPADFPGLMSVAAADNGCAGTSLSRVFLNVTAGTEYWISLSNYSDKFGAPYDLNVRSVTTPEISDSPIIYPQDDHAGIGQTLYAGVPDWFADPAITTADTQWQLCDSGGVVCNDIPGATDSSYEPVLGDLGQRLKLKVTGSNGVESTTVYSALSAIVESPPANDNFADAIDLGSTAPVTTTDDNYFGTTELDENAHSTVPIDASVWYRWTAPLSKTYFVDGCQASSATYFGVNVYNDGSPVDALTNVGSYSGGCENGGEGSRTFFAATAGSSYVIQVGSLASADFVDFTLSISQVPAPSFDYAPSLSGAARDGATLTAGFTAANGIPTDSAIDWTLCDAEGANCGALADDGTDQLELTTPTVGSRVKVTVTLTNANGSTSASALSDVIEPDTDGDGVADGDDSCPSEAGSRPNGCDPSDIVGAGAPAISGSTVVGQQLSVSTGTWNVLHDPLGYTLSYQWYRCPSAVFGSCSTVTSSATYTLTSADVGKFLRVLVTATNADDSATQGSAFTAAITAIPGGNTNPPPPNTPAATDPFPQPTAPKSLGKIKLKSGKVTLPKLSLLCGGTATGPCTGTITFTTAKTRKKGKTIKPVKHVVKLSVPPGRTMPTTFKLSSGMVKAVKTAKSLKTSIVIRLGAPGFSSKSLTTGATVSLK